MRADVFRHQRIDERHRRGLKRPDDLAPKRVGQPRRRPDFPETLDRIQPPDGVAIRLDQRLGKSDDGRQDILHPRRLEQRARARDERDQPLLQLVLPPLRRRERLLGTPALAYVAGDLRRADDRAVRRADRRDRERDRDQRAVLVLSNRLEMIDGLATANPGQDFRFLAEAVGGYDGRDRPADHFLRRVAEHALRPKIPRRDDAVQVLADDRVVGRRDEGREVKGRSIGCIRHAAARSVRCRVIYLKSTSVKSG